MVAAPGLPAAKHIALKRASAAQYLTQRLLQSPGSEPYAELCAAEPAEHCSACRPAEGSALGAWEVIGGVKLGAKCAELLCSDSAERRRSVRAKATHWGRRVQGKL
eukprot:scaffold6574_cov132-Isochrysis_galbana.AAC.3